MKEFKAGDWVRNLNDDIFKLEDTHMWQDLHSLFTHWKPKVGVLVINLYDEVFKLEDIHMWQDLHSLFTPWKPRVGDWVLITSVFSDYKYELVKVGTVLDKYTISPYEFPNEVISLSVVQPFLGTPPIIREY